MLLFLRDANDKRYVQLTWGASTDKCSGISQYRVYRNSKLLGSTVSSVRRYTDKTVKDGEKYQYKVVAIDGNNHNSKPAQTQVISFNSKEIINKKTRKVAYQPLQWVTDVKTKERTLKEVGKVTYQPLQVVINVKTKEKTLQPLVITKKPSISYKGRQSQLTKKSPISYKKKQTLQPLVPTKLSYFSNLKGWGNANSIRSMYLVDPRYASGNKASVKNVAPTKKPFNAAPNNPFIKQKSGNTTAWGNTNNYKTRYNYK